MESNSSATGATRALSTSIRARRGLLSALAPFAGLAAAALILYAVPPHAVVTLLDLRTVAVHTVIVATAAMGMTLIDRLSSLFPNSVRQLRVMRNNLAWKSIVQPAG